MFSLYFVPEDELRFAGREREVAEAFWALGLPLATRDEFILRRVEAWKAEGRPLPGTKPAFAFDERGVDGAPASMPVPNHVPDLVCPECDADLSVEAHETWAVEEDSIPLAERYVACLECGHRTRSAELRSRDTPFTFARIFLWIYGVEPEAVDDSFRRTVESVLGPCREFTSWDPDETGEP